MTKYFSAILFILFSLTTSAQVQRSKTRSAIDSSRTDVMSGRKNDKKERIKELNLSPEQKVKFKELKRAHKASKDAIENDATLSATQKKEKLKVLRKEQAEKMKSILTPEQMEKFKQSRKDKGDNF